MYIIGHFYFLLHTRNSHFESHRDKILYENIFQTIKLFYVNSSNFAILFVFGRKRETILRRYITFTEFCWPGMPRGDPCKRAASNIFAHSAQCFTFRTIFRSYNIFKMHVSQMFMLSLDNFIILEMSKRIFSILYTSHG